MVLLIMLFWLLKLDVSSSYRFEYPQPTFQKLMKENCMEPFFVFQVCNHWKLFCLLSYTINFFPFFLSFIQFFTLCPLCLICSLLIGLLCRSLVFGWILVLQFVYPIHAIYVWIYNGKKSAKDSNWAQTCKSGQSDDHGASLWEVRYLDANCTAFYFLFFI